MRRPRPRIAGLDTCYRTSHTADAFWFGSPSRTATARLRREQDERYEEEADEPNQHPRLVSHLLPPAVPLDYRRHTVPPRTAAAADRAVPPACLLCPPAPPLGSPPIWPRPSNASAPQSAPTGREVRVGKPDALRRTPPCGLTHHPRSLPPGARRALLSANHGRRRAPRGGGGWDAPPLAPWRTRTSRQQLPTPQGSRVIEIVVVHVPVRRSASRAMRLAERNGRGHCEAVDSEPTESPTRKAGPQLRKPRRSSSAARGTVSEPST